jgi:hypothetical protein
MKQPFYMFVDMETSKVLEMLNGIIINKMMSLTVSVTQKYSTRLKTCRCRTVMALRKKVPLLPSLWQRRHGHLWKLLQKKL